MASRGGNGTYAGRHQRLVSKSHSPVARPRDERRCLKATGRQGELFVESLQLKSEVSDLRQLAHRNELLTDGALEHPQEMLASSCRTRQELVTARKELAEQAGAQEVERAALHAEVVKAMAREREVDALWQATRICSEAELATLHAEFAKATTAAHSAEASAKAFQVEESAAANSNGSMQRANLELCRQLAEAQEAEDACRAATAEEQATLQEAWRSRCTAVQTEAHERLREEECRLRQAWEGHSQDHARQLHSAWEGRCHAAVASEEHARQLQSAWEGRCHAAVASEEKESQQRSAWEGHCQSAVASEEKESQLRLTWEGRCKAAVAAEERCLAEESEAWRVELAEVLEHSQAWKAASSREAHEVDTLRGRCEGWQVRCEALWAVTEEAEDRERVWSASLREERKQAESWQGRLEALQKRNLEAEAQHSRCEKPQAFVADLALLHASGTTVQRAHACPKQQAGSFLFS